MANPVLRFSKKDPKSSEWAEKAFNELFSFLNNKALSRAQLSEAGSIKNIHYGDILIKFGAIVDTSKSEIPFVKEDIDTSKVDQLRSGDVIFADAAEDQTVGKAVEIICGNDSIAISGLHTIPCRPVSRFGPKYLGYYLNSPAFHNKLLPLLVGTKVFSLSKGQLGTVSVKFPNVEAQEEIGEFFSTIDEKIMLSKKKLAALEKLKAGLMQKIFSRELRFKRENGADFPEWKLLRISDLISLKSGRDFSPDGYNDNGLGIPYLTGASCLENGLSIENRWTESPKCIANNGDILLVCKGNGVGKVGIVNQEAAHIARQFMAIRSKSNILSQEFCLYLIKSLVPKILRNATGMIVGVSRSDVLKNIVHVPDAEEQHKISEFLNNLDERIALAKHKFDILKKQKQAFMQQMFV